MKKKDFLKNKVFHIDIKSFNSVPIIDGFGKMAFQARNLARAAKIYDRMLADKNCAIILCLSGSLFSAGLKKVVYDMIYNDMVDAIVSTGAIMYDQDFFEALGFKHYQGDSLADDDILMRKGIDRIYDTFIDEDQLTVCDMTIAHIADNLSPGVYSSREFTQHMGKYLDKRKKGRDSVVLTAYKKRVPVFVPAFSDSTAGFGLVYHQYKRKD